MWQRERPADVIGADGVSQTQSGKDFKVIRCLCPRSKISFEVMSNGRETYYLSTLEELWHDFLWYRTSALSCWDKPPAFEARRFARAALFAYGAYMDGVLNGWCVAQFENDSTISKARRQEIVYGCIVEKCKYLLRRINLRGLETPILQYKLPRNALAHPMPGSDAELFVNINPEMLIDVDQDTAWLDEVGSVLGYERHPNTDEISKRVDEHLGRIPSSHEWTGPRL